MPGERAVPWPEATDAGPDPIGTSIVVLDRVEGPTLLVRGPDCLDGTPLLDVKPDRCRFTPLAPPTPGDSDIDATAGGHGGAAS